MGFPNLLRCNEDLVNIEEALMQGQLLQEAFACEKPETWTIQPTPSITQTKQHPDNPFLYKARGVMGKYATTLCQGWALI